MPPHKIPAMKTPAKRKNTEAQYATLLPIVKEDMDSKNEMPVGIILLSGVILAGAGFMKWKGLI